MYPLRLWHDDKKLNFKDIGESVHNPVSPQSSKDKKDSKYDKSRKTLILRDLPYFDPFLSLGFCGETGFWTCQPILSVYQRYNIKVKNKCSKIVAHFWRLFETLLNAYAIILSRFKDTKKRTHCQMLYNKYFQPLHCYTF